MIYPQVTFWLIGKVDPTFWCLTPLLCGRMIIFGFTTHINCQGVCMRPALFMLWMIQPYIGIFWWQRMLRLDPNFHWTILWHQVDQSYFGMLVGFLKMRSTLLWSKMASHCQFSGAVRVFATTFLTSFAIFFVEVSEAGDLLCNSLPIAVMYQFSRFPHWTTTPKCVRCTKWIMEVPFSHMRTLSRWRLHQDQFICVRAFHQ